MRVVVPWALTLSCALKTLAAACVSSGRGMLLGMSFGELILASKVISPSRARAVGVAAWRLLNLSAIAPSLAGRSVSLRLVSVSNSALRVVRLASAASSVLESWSASAVAWSSGVCILVFNAWAACSVWLSCSARLAALTWTVMVAVPVMRSVSVAVSVTV